MAVRAKFRVESITELESNCGEVKLRAVTGGSNENLTFWKFTPAGTITMHIDNPVSMKQFIPGQEFYVDFIPA